jgi:hypothetical protein
MKFWRLFINWVILVIFWVILPILIGRLHLISTKKYQIKVNIIEANHECNLIKKKWVYDKRTYYYPWFNGCFIIFIVFIIISH